MRRYIKQIFFIIIFLVGISFGVTQINAIDGLVGDIVNFAPESNYANWIIRTSGANSGRGQTFVTPPGTTAIDSVAFKVCRISDFTKPKIMTLCPYPESNWYTGCANPLAIKTFTPEELNAMVPWDINCPALGHGGEADTDLYKWEVFRFDEPVPVSENTSYFIFMNSDDPANMESLSVMRAISNNCGAQTNAEYPYGQTYYYKGATRYTEPSGAVCDEAFKIFSGNPIVTPFKITKPQPEEPAIDDSWVDVSGTCPTNGENRIGLTDDCLGFEQIEYNLSCVDNTFSGKIYHSGLSDRIIARDIDSVSGDCVDYDNLMDMVEVNGIEVINGYPDDWYFNFDYFEEYDIKIQSPKFDTVLALPDGTESTVFTFAFIFPDADLPNMNFNIKQYDKDGNLLNASYHNKDISDMADKYHYQVALDAIPAGYHYVVQLTKSGEMMRQYPFKIYVSDLDTIINPGGGNELDYFFPRLVESLKQKAIFSYYFAFHDGFYAMFNTKYASVADDALDVSFKSVSANKQYNIDVKIFSASDPRVKSFASGLRPYITAILWLVFALYVIFRITHLFSDNE